MMFAPPIPRSSVDEALRVQAGNIVRPFTHEGHRWGGSSEFSWRESGHEYWMNVDYVPHQRSKDLAHRDFEVSFQADEDYNKLLKDVDATNVMATSAHALFHHAKAQAHPPQGKETKIQHLHYLFRPSREKGEEGVPPLATKRGHYYSRFVQRLAASHPQLAGVNVEAKNVNKEYAEVAFHFPKPIGDHFPKNEAVADFLRRVDLLLEREK